MNSDKVNTPVDKKQEAEGLVSLLKDIEHELANKKDFNNLKIKAKELSKMLNNFETKDLASLITNPLRDDSPVSILAIHYDPKFELKKLKSFFEFTSKNNNYPLDNGSILDYKNFFNHLTLFYITKYRNLYKIIVNPKQ